AGEHEAYEAELADRIPMKPWSALGPQAVEALAGFDGGADPDYVVMHALVDDGVLYYQPSQTPRGAYPYPERMRFGVWSITKSVGPGLGMLRLAQKYGDWVFDLELIDYLPIDPPHDGWEGVTFGDALNMATGLGGGTTDANPNDMFVDYTWLGDYVDWYEARTTEEKIAALELVDDYPWGPGEVARYRDRDMFALGVAMNNFLKSVEGDDADIWRMIAEEVFAPIGIHHAPMNRTFEPDGGLGQPIMAWGWYPNLGDLAKVAELLHERGRHNGRQLLHPELTESLFSVEGTLTKGPANALKYGVGRYKMGFHYAPFPVDGETIWLPVMSGYVGNRVVPLPNGMTVIRISNAWPAPADVVAAVEDPTSMIEAANRLEPFAE
ncbi:MAG TPA: serine hydrolase, partial [Paracoccaceae bacterium]|nr:serine hydrolase [Paracoccaceae bacterium]